METCYIRVENGWEEVEFMGLFQRSRGSQKDVISGPIAVVKIFVQENGKTSGYLNEVHLDQLRFVE